MNYKMTRSQAQAILDEILVRDFTKRDVEQGLQLAVDHYVEEILKQHPRPKLNSVQWEFDKKSENLTRTFQQALRNKLKKIRSQKETQDIPKEMVKEEKFILSEVCKMLEMTPQNLNHLLRNHTDIKVVEISSRKRYLTKSEIEKVKKIGRNIRSAK